ncbi:MAG: YggS family pyridoxal phosphate-dependent enzyme [candidate division NC10 bacterium]|nr:YggS family pyridoxal phosphate-dependent enzyme [candidate division NC10 bacterium]
MEGIAERVGTVRDRIAAAAARSGRDPADITLVAVSKAFPPEAIRAAEAAGVTDIGESRVQEAVPKVAAVGRGVRWHLVGHLQTNKAKTAVRHFDWIHSLDSLRLAEALQKAAVAGSLEVVPVLVEVNLGGEASKAGLPEADLLPLLRGLAVLPRVRVEGLMAIPPFLEDPEAGRPYFGRLRALGEKARSEGLPHVRMAHLSMGMSHDFEVAVEEGATMVRVGTAIFGPRP